MSYNHNQNVVLGLFKDKEVIRRENLSGENSVVRAVGVGYVYLKSWPHLTAFVVVAEDQLNKTRDEQEKLWVGLPGDEHCEKKPSELKLVLESGDHL